MKSRSFILAIAVVVASNVLTLLHVWRNRTGPVEASLTLTERELYIMHRPSKDDSSVMLRLVWEADYINHGLPWLTKDVLQEIGFNTSVDPTSQGAYDFYNNQHPRTAYVAFEYAGPSWQKYVDRTTNLAENHSYEKESQLFAIDAASNPEILRTRHPNRQAVVIIPAVVRIALDYGFDRIRRNNPKDLYGVILDVPSNIHIPQPFAQKFRNLPVDASFKVHLQYGPHLEPYVTTVH